MRDAGSHVSFEQPAVERKRLIEFGKSAIRLPGEAASPKILRLTIVHNYCSLCSYADKMQLFCISKRLKNRLRVG